MNDFEGQSSLSDMIQNLELSQYSASLLQELSDAFSSFNSSEITGSPASMKSKLFLSPLAGDESLRSQIRQRDNIIDAMRLKYNRTITQLTEKLVQTNNDITEIKKQYKEKLDDMRMHCNQTQTELETSLKKEIEQLAAKNRARRDNLTFSRLPEVNETEYSRLKSEKQSNLSIPQFVAMQLYEHDMEFKQKVADSQRLRDEAISKMEKTHTKMNDMNTSLITERELRISLEQKMATLSSKTIASKPIGEDVSTGNALKIKRLEDETNELRNSCQTALQRCNETALLLDTQKKENNKLEATIIRLKSENQSLSSQIATINSFANRQESYLQDLKSENAELKRVRDDFYFKCINTAEQRKNDIGSALQSDLQHITENSRSNIEYIRAVSDKMHEREVSVLQNTLDKALDEVKELRVQLRKSEETRSALQSEYQTIQATHNAEISRLSSELNSKKYELASVQLHFDEMTDTNQDLQDERDALQMKFNLVLQELNKLKADIDIRENQLKDATEKINTYEKLESELDHAIETMDLNSVGPLAIPSDANRRMKQSIQLSKRVMMLTKDNKELQTELTNLQQTIVEITEQNQSLANQVKASGQPQQVFVSMLTEKQNEIDKLKKRIGLLTDQNQQISLEKQSMQRDFSILSNQQEDLKYSAKIAQCPFAPQDEEPTHEAVDPAPFIIIRRD